MAVIAQPRPTKKKIAAARNAKISGKARIITPKLIRTNPTINIPDATFLDA